IKSANVANTAVFRWPSTHFKARRYASTSFWNNLLKPLLLNCACTDFSESNLEDSIGTIVSAATMDANSENVTVNAIGVNKSEARPPTYTIGRNTTIVVIVEATTAEPSSDAPFFAAS